MGDMQVYEREEVSEDELKSIFTTLLLRLIEADQAVVCELQKINANLEAHRQKCKIAKTTGVTVAGAGTLVCVGSFIAGLALAPVTMGASLAAPIVISGIVGTTASVAGGLTAAGTSIVDGVVTKNYLLQIQDLQSEQVDLANQVLNTLSLLVKYKVEHLVRAGEDEEAAIAKVIEQLNGGNGTLSATVVLPESKDNAAKNKACDKPEYGSMEGLDADPEEMEPCLPKQKNHSRDANKNITFGSLSAAKNAGTLMITTMPGVQTKILGEVFKSSGTALGGAVAKTVVQSLTVAVGLVFTVVDVTYLVKGWNTSHPLVTEIEKIVAAIQEHIKECEALLGRVKEI